MEAKRRKTNDKGLDSDRLRHDPDTTDSAKVDPDRPGHDRDIADSAKVDIHITKLQRSLSLSNVVALMLSLTGHVAVFITPGIILGLAGSLVSCIILWCVGSLGVYTMALCFTEMATIFQKAGGPYLYVTETLGELPGFLVAYGYIALISGPFLAFISKTAALYVIKAFVIDADCDSEYYQAAIQILAGWILLTMTYLNCSFFKVVLKLQSFLTLMRLIAIAIIIVSGIYFFLTNSIDNFETPLEGSHFEPGSLSLGFVYVTFSLGGWQAICPLTEEIQNPEKTMPRAIHISFAIQVSLSLLTYLSYMSVLDKAEMVSNNAIALLFCLRIWRPLVVVISILVSLACIGALNSGVMGHSRVLYAAARNGVMPSLLNTLHAKQKTPTVSLLSLALYGIILIYSGGSDAMMEFIGLFSYIMSLNVICGLFYLRFTQPSLPRPYRVPTCIAVLQLLLGIILIIFIIYQRPLRMSVGIAIYLSGIPVYYFLVKWKDKPKMFTEAVGKVTRFCQILLQQAHD